MRRANMYLLQSAPLIGVIFLLGADQGLPGWMLAVGTVAALIGVGVVTVLMVLGTRLDTAAARKASSRDSIPIYRVRRGRLDHVVLGITTWPERPAPERSCCRAHHRPSSIERRSANRIGR